MSGRGDLPRLLRALAWLCLRVYPRDFRRDSGADYRAVIAHRWALERRRSGGVAGALRTAWLLLIDTARAGPAAHSGSLRRGTNEAGGTGRLHRLVFWRDGVVADTRVAVRSVARRPGLSALVVVTFGLGIGANLTLFGALDRVVLRALPFPDGDRMVYLALRDPVRGWQFTPTLEALARWREGARTLEWVELYLPGSATLTEAGPAELLQVTHVSARLAAGLGVRALVGRVPGDQELTSSAPPQVLLSESYWRREFGADAGVVGSTILLNDTLFTVAGVWPAAARLELSRAPDLWRVHRGDQHFRPGSFGYVLALVREGAGVAEVEAELAALAAGIEGVPAGVLPAVNPPYGFLGDEYVRGLWLVFGGVVVLLLPALVNAANLLLNRAVSRAGELGVRAALGATRSSLLRLFLAEGAVLTALGLLLAAVVGRFGGTALAAMVPERLTVLRDPP